MMPTTHQTITVPGVGAVNLVTVTIQNYQFTTLVPFVIPDITLGPISTTMRAPATRFVETSTSLAKSPTSSVTSR